MGTQSIKAKVANNIVVAMSDFVDRNTIGILEKVVSNEFVRVNMDEITTLPVEYKNDVEERNKYIIQLFLVKKRDLAKGTKEGYLHAVRRLITEINTKSLDKMDDTDIDWYLAQYEKRNVSDTGKRNQATTVNNERRFLSAFYTWMRKAKLISENPVESTESKKVFLKPIDYYTPEEMAKIRDACKNKRERAIIEVFRSTGARVGEVAAITLDQIDIDTGDILIQGEKGGKYRTIYLDDDARYYFKQYLDTRWDDSQYMFPTSRAPYGMMSTCAFRSIMKEIGRRAELKCRVYPHKMRKTLGMNLKNKGVDIGTIQEVLGHASPAVTSQYYAQSTPRTLRSVRERLAA